MASPPAATVAPAAGSQTRMPDAGLMAERDAPVGGNYVYGVSYANIGRGEAGSFSVALFVDGALADSREIGGLGPGEGSTVYLNGPACKRLRAVIDRENAVPETNEGDNSYRARC